MRVDKTIVGRANSSNAGSSSTMKPDSKLRKQHLGYSSKLEIIFCYVINLYYCYFIISNVANISQTAIDARRYRHLQSGWFAGRNIDLTDTQWRMFRENLPLQIVGAVAFLFISYLVQKLMQYYYNNSAHKNYSVLSGSNDQTRGEDSNYHTKLSIHYATDYMCWFYFLVSLCIEVYLYGTGVTFMLFVLLTNYYVGSFIYSQLFDKICIQTLLGSSNSLNYNRYERNFKCILIWIYNLSICYFILQYSQSSLFTFETIFADYFGILTKQNAKWFDLLIDRRIHWKDTYRFMLLRTISFQMDQNYYHRNIAATSNDNDDDVDKDNDEKEDKRIYKSLFDLNYLNFAFDYSVVKYFAYMLYYPLHIAGPTISYHDWLAQVKSNIAGCNPYKTNEKDVSALTLNYKIIYLLRYLFCFLCNEIILHFCYTHCLSRFGYPMKRDLQNFLRNAETSGNFNLNGVDSNIREELNDYIVGLGCFSYLHLNSIWLKFLLIWRFTRFFALLDNIVTVENMQRCITNSNSIVDFWKYWHSSFNLWNKRYIFIPLGGSGSKGRKKSNNANDSGQSMESIAKNLRQVRNGTSGNTSNKSNERKGTLGTVKVVFNIILVFTFTALWHGDFNLSLIAWGGIMALAMIPEILISNWFWSSKISLVDYCRNNERISRYIAAFGGSINIFILIFANEVGYGPGLSTMMHLFRMMVASLSGMMLIVYSMIWFVVAVMCMFHLRYLEHYNVFNPLLLFAKFRSKNKGHLQ